MSGELVETAGGPGRLSSTAPTPAPTCGDEHNPRAPLLGVGASFSVGIMAYNEAANIAHAIRSLLHQNVTSARLDELIVVASGCTDATAEIVDQIAVTDRRVRLVIEAERLGKASAINRFIAEARAPLLLMAGGDMLVKMGSVEAMLRAFADPEVGMVGGHPVPVNDESSFLGYTVHLLWRLHDRLAREAPKLGEIVAFRNVVPSIPRDTAVDEISLQALVTQLGYRVVYEPLAVAYNRGPTTVHDFLRQRRRIYAGHLQVKHRQGYSASTMSIRRIGRALRGSGSFSTPRLALWTAGAMGLEAIARGLGYVDSVLGRPHAIWRQAITTKTDIVEIGDGQRPACVLVFHIIDFYHHQLEVGARLSQLHTHALVDVIRSEAGKQAVIAAQTNGTVIALVSADREQAERIASRVIAKVKSGRVISTPDTDSWRLSCGVIAFPQSGSNDVAVLAGAALEPRVAVLGVPAKAMGARHSGVAGWE